jgi:hypothetical protein
MSSIFRLMVAALGALLLSGCVFPPETVLEAYDDCDYGAELCYFRCPIPGEDNFPALIEGTAGETLAEAQERVISNCRAACSNEANRCFFDVTAIAEARHGQRLDPDYVFYGRAGFWSPRFGWVGEAHDQPYTYSRYGLSDPSPYDDYYRYDPYDCFGWPRPYWCDERYRYGRYDRRYRWPTPDQPAPDEPELQKSEQPFVPKMSRPAPTRPVPAPSRVERPDNRPAPQVAPVRPAPQPPARTAPTTVSPPPSTAPVQSTPAPRPTPAPVQRTRPQPQPEPAPERTPRKVEKDSNTEER